MTKSTSWRSKSAEPSIPTSANCSPPPTVLLGEILVSTTSVEYPTHPRIRYFRYGYEWASRTYPSHMSPDSLGRHLPSHRFPPPPGIARPQLPARLQRPPGHTYYLAPPRLRHARVCFNTPLPLPRASYSSRNLSQRPTDRNQGGTLGGRGSSIGTSLYPLLANRVERGYQWHGTLSGTFVANDGISASGSICESRTTVPHGAETLWIEGPVVSPLTTTPSLVFTTLFVLQIHRQHSTFTSTPTFSPGPPPLPAPLRPLGFVFVQDFVIWMGEGDGG